MHLSFPAKLLLGLGAILLAWPLAAGAQAPLLPAELGGFQRTDWQPVEAPELEQVAGAQAALLREYGCQRAERARYQRGAAEWRVTVYEMVDRSAAYGAFTLLGEPTGSATFHRVAIGEGGVAGVDTALFYQGNYLVRDWVGGALNPPIGELAKHLERLAGTQASLPTLPRYLPREGFIENSDRYLLGPLALEQVAPLVAGDWAGFAYGAEAEAARYRLEPGEATLLLLSYPTPQIAAARLRDFEQLFNLNGAGEPTRTLAFARRQGTLVVFVTGVQSGQAAGRLLDRVQYTRELSWSEPSAPRPQVNWPLTILNIFIGTGLLLLFTLLSGLAFGAVRLLVKRLLPGKVFDRPEDTEIIRLDLNFRS